MQVFEVGIRFLSDWSVETSLNGMSRVVCGLGPLKVYKAAIDHSALNTLRYNDENELSVIYLFEWHPPNPLLHQGLLVLYGGRKLLMSCSCSGVKALLCELCNCWIG